ncbi:MAG: two-component system response regulator [Deltaproteobacteria bacterium RBG_13_65_10]|nr:MAG: two-component system response regulator [Deltaproteobacteria bacterium RBG_13_65_10]
MPCRRGETVSSHILVVDDSSVMRSLLISTLDGLGDVQVTETGSGFEALRLLARKKFDLIITDINMPDINGLELVSFVKRHPVYQTIPLIIVTTERGVRDREKGIALGAQEYLIKPFDPKQLQALAAKYLVAGKERASRG